MNYTIIGAARSGLAAAKLAKELGNRVFLSESAQEDKFKDAISELDRHGIEYEFGGNTEKALDKCDTLIVSPGVPPTAAIIINAEKKGIPVISELEFAWRQINNPVIAITGTNGKTTTTSLTAFILNQAGKHAVSCGNIGNPLSAVVKDLRKDSIVVLEVSSYQLDRTVDFRPDVAMVLNLTPDHLGYHGSLENYYNAKFKISSQQNEKNFLILNGDDKTIRGIDYKTKARILEFSMSPVDWGIYNKGGEMWVKIPQQQKEEKIMLFDEIRLPGVHNAYNSMAAALAARAFEVRNENIRDSLMAFDGVEHRLEHVRTINSVDYINDSKATNVNATWYALNSYKRPLIWIAGGRGDNNDYSALDESVKSNVKEIIAIGEEADAIFNNFSSFARCHRPESLEAAVEMARSIAEEGDIVLFTPACKSFDMFMNFEHRGEVFKQIVMNL